MSPVLAAPDGAKLYGRNCAACHGETGTGGIGVPLALPSFQAGISDDYLRKTIRLGRPGRVMPSFAHLDKAEIEAIVRHVRGWNKGPAATYSTRPVKGDPVHGRQLFGQYCAACHGANGEGSKGTGVTFSRPRDLPIMAPALHNPGFLAAATDAMIKATLMHGRKGTPMTSFLKQGLKEKDIDDIVSYVRSFEKQPLSESAQVLEAESPVIVRDSSYDLKTTVENVKQAVTTNNFFYGRVQMLEYGLIEPARENPKQVIVYFCNISLLNQALAVDPRVGMFLPCRITILERDDGKVQVMSV
ncbi:MAG: c-type cytochrome, partial [Candidatus Thermoplasmatota archaeon]|nr:c-type cytochrome [Candidatus Thermoplasmatota archaeon]